MSSHSLVRGKKKKMEAETAKYSFHLSKQRREMYVTNTWCWVRCDALTGALGLIFLRNIRTIWPSNTTSRNLALKIVIRAVRLPDGLCFCSSRPQHCRDGSSQDQEGRVDISVRATLSSDDSSAMLCAFIRGSRVCVHTRVLFYTDFTIWGPTSWATQLKRRPFSSSQPHFRFLLSQGRPFLWPL